MNSQSQQENGRTHLAVQVIFAGILTWGCTEAGPLYVGGGVNWVTAILALILLILLFEIAQHVLIRLAHHLDYLASHEATGKEGTARWGSYEDIQ